MSSKPGPVWATIPTILEFPWQEVHGNMLSLTIIPLITALFLAQIPAPQTGAASLTTASTPDERGPISDSQRTLLKQALAVTVHLAAENRPNHTNVTVDLTNLSGKTITAFSYSVTAEYADGHRSLGSTEFDILDNSIHGIATGKTLKAFETMHTSETVPSGPNGSMPLVVRVEPTMVIFMDRTAIGSYPNIQRRLADRKSVGEQLSAVLADIRMAQTAEDVQNSPAGQTRDARLRAQLDNRALALQKGTPDRVSLFRADIIRKFSDVLARGGGAALDKMISIYQETQSAMAEHSTLEVVQ